MEKRELRGLGIEQIRKHIRSGAYTGDTMGVVDGQVQANLVVLPNTNTSAGWEGLSASRYPNRAGTTEKRVCKIVGDELNSVNPTAASGGTSYANYVRAK